jgi:hypothetical protein
MMSTTNTRDLVHLITNFISNLSEEQQENLLSGNAEIEYNETREFRFNNRLKRQVLQCNNVKDIEKVFEGMFKWGITSFCEFYGINVNSRDTKQSLYQKIAYHFNIEINETKSE